MSKGILISYMRMGKKNPTVSIVTITQRKRFACLDILKDMIKQQTYKNIIEWIIVEGSKSDEDASANTLQINAWKESLEMPFNVIYLEKVSGEKLGALRNKGNRKCSGEITVVMDDDDYYPEVRVSHAVDKLMGSMNLIAGCSDMLIYDYTLNTLCKFKGFGPNHSVNNCFAWKRKYLEKYSHDESKEMGEEPSFTRNFTEPMVQLDSEKTVIQSSHSSNTFNKRELLTGAVVKINPSLIEIGAPITDYIKEPFFTRLRDLFYKESVSKYDITYFTGGFYMKWEPASKSLTGSEQAVVHLASEWVKSGKKVAVYGNVTETTHNGVDYIDWKKFPFDEVHNTVILWRLYGIMCGGPFPIKATNIWWDLHDGVMVKQALEAWFRYGKKITKLFFKSAFHKELFEKATRSKIEKFAIIENGIRKEEFSVNRQSVARNPYRFCYTSCYTRGLGPIIQYMWPIIYNAEPRAELHVYGAMDYVDNVEFKNMMKTLLASPGVMDHGKQPVDIIARELYMSSFHLYPTNSDAEVDCIPVRESCIAGAIPLISNYGIFKQRDGIHFDLEHTKPESYSQIGLYILDIIKRGDLDIFRQTIQKSASANMANWVDIAKKWLDQ